MPLMKILLNVSLVSVFFTVASVSHAVKVYKWVDKQGNVTYQETPPPEESITVEEKDINPNRNVYEFGNPRTIQPAAVSDSNKRRTNRTTRRDAAIRGGAAVGRSSSGVSSTPPIFPSPPPSQPPPPLQPPPPPQPPPPGGF